MTNLKCPACGNQMNARTVPRFGAGVRAIWIIAATIMVAFVGWTAATATPATAFLDAKPGPTAEMVGGTLALLGILTFVLSTSAAWVCATCGHLIARAHDQEPPGPPPQAPPAPAAPAVPPGRSPF